jgi:hypothetical protein
MSSPETTAPPAGETPTQKQARLRRERRQAKIQAEGSSRLQAIAGLSGRQHAAENSMSKDSANAEHTC